MIKLNPKLLVIISEMSQKGLTMKKNLLFIFITLISMTYLLGGAAEAKRLGGGSSFGGKKSYSSPFKKSSTQKKSSSQQKAAATNQQKKQQFSKRGGLMGMLGGLALGGLLGAMFFGGAFEGFNFFDFILIGGIIFAIYWFMKRRKASAAARPTAAAGATGSTQDPMQFDTSRSDTSLPNSNSLKNQLSQYHDNSKPYKNNDHSENSDADFSQDDSSAVQPTLPGWFDQEKFLNGARSCYLMLQKAWDDGNLDEIKGLTTAHVYSEIQTQLLNQPSKGATRILQINAELIDFNELEEQTEAAVMFDNLIAESDAQGNEGRSNQVRELWHFIRAKDSTDPTWYLDGIQQIEG
jgi:predicted lipid-binding transport protein (Tim44 family)